MASSRPSHRGPDKIFGIPKHHSDSQHPGGRSYDYTQKYLPDELGKEADHEARIWKVYLDEAESYDEDMVRGFRDTIDSLLVLAGLFSAVVASFVVQTSLNLKPDYAQLTVVLLSEQVALLRAAGVGSSSTIVPATGVSAATATYNTFDVWINGLFFTSLSLGMFTALLAVLSKQWLQAYIALTSGSAKDRALARQFRFNGLQRWRLEHVVGFLPLILHAAFGVFFLGLCIFVYHLHQPLTWIIAALSSLVGLVYFLSIFLPAIWLDCPYRIALVFQPTRFAVRACQVVWFAFRYLWAIVFGKPKPKRPHLSIRPLKEEERNVLRTSVLDTRPNLRDEVLCTSLTWLWQLSNNSSVHEIITKTLHGLLFRSPQNHENDFPPVLFHDSKLPLSSMAVVCTLGIYVASNDDDASGSALFWFSIFIRMKAVPGNSFSNVYQAEFYLERVIYAAGRGHLRFIQAFVQAGGDINQKHHNESILQAASGSGHVDLVRFLLSHDADIVNGSERPEALTAAANAEHIEVVQAFVEHHRSITPANFFAALRKQNSAILKVFLSAGSTPNMVDEQQNSALEVASRDLQDLALIQLLLEYRVDLTRGGVEALRVASHHGNLDVVELLLEKGVDPNQDTFSQISPLQAASEQGHLKVVETLRGKLSLLKFKVFTSTPATFHSEGGGFGSPLHAACARGHWDVVQNLTTQHYDSQGRPQQLTQYVGHGLLDTQGQIPLAAAILHRPANPNRLHIIRFFLNHLKSSGSPWEGHLDLSDPIHGTILHVAASVGDTGAAEYLLPHIDVNLRAGPYDTALQTACEHNHLTFVRFLLDHGANPNTDIENHPRSLFCAAQNHNLEMVEALLSRDADASARSDISGKSEGTAIDVSKNLGFADVVDLLTRSRI